MSLCTQKNVWVKAKFDIYKKNLQYRYMYIVPDHKLYTLYTPLVQQDHYYFIRSNLELQISLTDAIVVHSKIHMEDPINDIQVYVK